MRVKSGAGWEGNNGGVKAGVYTKNSELFLRRVTW